MLNKTPEEFGYEAKFPVFTDFLDKTFYRRRQAREGESYEDYCVEMHREMLCVIERLRKEFGTPVNSMYALSVPAGVSDGWTPKEEFKYKSHVIDYAANEKLEIAIDNAPTLEDLAKLKEDADKQGLTDQYMNRLKQLTNGNKD